VYLFMGLWPSSDTVSDSTDVYLESWVGAIDRADSSSEAVSDSSTCDKGIIAARWLDYARVRSRFHPPQFAN
jgi:hypothetical protein